MCGGDHPPPLPDPAHGVMPALCALYKAKVLPLEKHQDYEFFDGPYLEDAEFTAKPSVLAIGQYSVGKTTLIHYLVGEDIPGSRIGPEPTTDTFTFVMHNESSRIIPGTSLMAEATFPYKGLSKFGASFLSKCNAATCPSPLLKHVNFIDTPGILSGEKQRVTRGYNFEQVVSYLAEKVDRILLLFDAHKLDISDELKRTILATTGNEEKIRIVLNKVDSLEPSALQRVNGALMWSLGKVLKCPEVPKVYVGSFWDQPLKYPQYRELFQNDTTALFEDIRSLPRTVNVRRINDVVKRAKQIRIFTYIMDELIRCIGFGICASKEAVIKDLENIVYPKVCLKYRIPFGDLPPAEDLKQKLAQSNEKDWHPLNRKTRKLLDKLDEFLKNDVTKLIQALPSDAKISVVDYGPLATESRIYAGQIEHEMQWSNVLAQAERRHWRRTFESLPLDNGKLHAADARAFLLKSGLPQAVLGEILKLVDTDGDNKIDLEEFYLLSFLIDRKLTGKDVPKVLPASVLPPPSSRSKSRSIDSKDDLINKLQASLDGGGAGAGDDGKKLAVGNKSRDSKGQRNSSVKKSTGNATTATSATKKTSSAGAKKTDQ